MRLGKIEKSILLACLEKRTSDEETVPDVYRDELPALLFGWRPLRRSDSYFRLYNRPPLTYAIKNRDSAEYNRKQATITKAVQSLWAKGLIDTGPTYEVVPRDERAIYNDTLAARAGVEISQTSNERYTDEELDRTRRNPITGHYFSLRRRVEGQPEKMGRNTKAIRLTDSGLQMAQSLKVKYDKQD